MSNARIVGKERLNVMLKQLPGATRSAIKQAIAAGADEIMALQKRTAPKRPGSGKLRDSITQTWGGGRVKWSSMGTKGGIPGDPDMTVRISAGNSGVRYSHLVEFGTKPHDITKMSGRRWYKRLGTKPKSRRHPGAKAQPFFYPSYRLLRKKVKSRISRAAVKAIRQIAKNRG